MPLLLALHLILSFSLAAMTGWPGWGVCAASILLGFFSYRHPEKGYEAFLFFLPWSALLTVPYSSGRAISLLLPPFSVVLWSFLRNPTVVYDLRNLSYPGKKWLHIFIVTVVVTSFLAIFRLAMLEVKGLPASIPPWGPPLSVPRAMGWIFMATLGKINGFFLFFLSIYLMKKSDQPEFLKKRWIMCLAGGFVISLIVGYVQVLFDPSWGNSPGFSEDTQICSTFSDPNAFAYSLVLFLPLLASMFIGKIRDNFPRKIFLLILFLGFLPLLLYAGSRSALLEFCLMVVLAALFIAWRHRSFKPILTVFMLLGVIFIAGYNTPAVLRLRSKYSYMRPQTLGQTLTSSRIRMWKSGYEVLKERPIFGVGSGGYLLELPKIVTRYPDYIKDNTGNQYLQLAVENGVLGLVFWLLFIGTFLLAAKGLYPFAQASITAMLIAFLYGPHTQFLEVELLFAFTLALAGVWGTTDEKQLIMNKIKDLKAAQT